MDYNNEPLDPCGHGNELGDCEDCIDDAKIAAAEEDAEMRCPHGHRVDEGEPCVKCRFSGIKTRLWLEQRVVRGVAFSPALNGGSNVCTLCNHAVARPERFLGLGVREGSGHHIDCDLARLQAALDALEKPLESK